MNRTSAIYEGTVRHRRFHPVEHEFENRLFMMYIDLDELPTLFARVPFWSHRRAAPARFKRSDFFGDSALSLKEAVVRRVEEEIGFRPQGPVRVLTHLRYFGHIFNPVSFYYVYSRDETLQAILAEITNTPWKERHAYVLRVPPERPGEGYRFRFGKQFHVSPFMDMNLEYDWRVSEPGDRLVVHMENHRDRSRLFDATLRLQRKELSAWSLNGALIRFPFMTLRVVAGIYLHAARLWLKRAPFYSHPAKRRPSPPDPVVPLEKSP